jgi:hypothetical protein
LPASGQQRNITTDRLKVINIAISQIGTVEEYTNGGKQVNVYLKTVGLGTGYYWCAAFQKWVFNTAGIKTPGCNGAAASFFNKGRNVYQKGGKAPLEAVQIADNVSFYYTNLGRIGHIALVEKIEANAFITIEGNTSEAGSRNGDGVYRKRRMKRSIYSAADWVAPKV